MGIFFSLLYGFFVFIIWEKINPLRTKNEKKKMLINWEILGITVFFPFVTSTIFIFQILKCYYDIFQRIDIYVCVCVCFVILIYDYTLDLCLISFMR